MIKSFKDKETQKLFMGRKSKAVSQQVSRKALRLLTQLDLVGSVEEMATPPGNRLHKLGGDREDEWAVWIDKQYRITFRFEDGDAHDVEATDYH